MSNTLKGVLLSALIFPGLGHIVLKQYKKGAVFAFVAAISLLVLLIKSLQKSLAILKEIQSGGGAVDMNAIPDIVARSSSSSDNLLINLSMVIILGCWVYGIVDVYKIGRAMDMKSVK